MLSLCNTQAWCIVDAFLLMKRFALRQCILKRCRGQDGGGHSITTWTKFTQFLPPPPSSGEKWKFYVLFTFCHVAPLTLWTFYWLPTPSSCPHSYWMTPSMYLRSLYPAMFFSSQIIQRSKQNIAGHKPLWYVSKLYEINLFIIFLFYNFKQNLKISKGFWNA